MRRPILKRILNHWYDLNLIIAIILIILIVIQQVNSTFQQRLLLFEFAFINLHVWEEYAHPGDMPGTLNVAVHHNQKSPTRYPFNQFSAFICNDLFMIIIWGVPILAPQWTGLTLSAILWGIIEFFLHLIYYPHQTHSTLSGGIVTALLGFLPCGVIYLAFASTKGYLTVPNLTIGILYPIMGYLIIFRWLGARIMANKRSRFPFTAQQIAKYLKTIKSHPIHHHKPGTL